MSSFVRIASADEIPEDEGRTFAVGELAVAVFNVGGRFWAIEDTCLHRGGSLGRGELDGPVVTCPVHGWEWDVTTGELCFKRAIALDRFEVRVEDGDVLVATAPAS